MKAATTSMAAYLGQHPDIYEPPIKEPNHFCRELHQRNISAKHPATVHFNLVTYLQTNPLKKRFFAFVENDADYRSLYRDRGTERYALDASTTYLNSPVAARLIAAKVPDARVIIITRDPAERAWAEFVMNQRIGTATTDSRAALDRELKILQRGDLPLFERYASTGLYTEHIARYRAALDPLQLFVMDVTEFTTDAEGLSARLWAFLDLPAIDQRISRENEAVSARSNLVNRLLFQNPLRYAVAGKMPEAVRSMFRAILYSRNGPSMPSDFPDLFDNYLDRAREAWNRAGWNDYQQD